MVSLAAFEAYGVECPTQTLWFIQKPGHVADAATVMLLSDGNNVNFNHNSLDTITSDKVGTYRVRKNRYHTNVYPYIFLCEIESVPTEILVPGQTTEFMVDDPQYRHVIHSDRKNLNTNRYNFF